MLDPCHSSVLPGAAQQNLCRDESDGVPLAAVTPYSSWVQQPVRATAFLGRCPQPNYAALFDREQGRACSLHPDGSAALATQAKSYRHMCGYGETKSQTIAIYLLESRQLPNVCNIGALLYVRSGQFRPLCFSML